MKHYFITQPDVIFPENWFCAKCGEYFTHPNHLHSRDCKCKTCEQKRILTPRALDGAERCPNCDKSWDKFFCAECGYCAPPRQ